MANRAQERKRKAAKAAAEAAAEQGSARGPSSGTAPVAASALRLGGRERAWLLAALLLTGGLYGATLGHSFQFDELWKVVDNPALRSTDAYFKDLGSGRNLEETTRLLPNLTFVLDYKLYGYEPFGYQLTELLLHLLVVMLVAAFGLALSRQMGERSVAPVLVGAALFAIHPLNSEAVNYTNARPNVLLTAFYLACLTSLLGLLRASSPRARALYGAGAALALVGALLSKEIGFSIAVMVPALLWWLWPSAPAELRARLARWRLWSVAVVMLGVGALALTGGLDGIRDLLVDTAPQLTGHWSVFLLVTALGQSVVFLQYAGLALLPLPQLLNADRSPVGHLHEALFQDGAWREGAERELVVPVLCAVLLVGVLVFVLRYRQRAPYVSFLGLWPFVAHAPTSLMPRGEPMVEYRTYLPMVGICLLLGWALCKLGERTAAWRPAWRGLQVPAAVLLWTVLAGMTATRNQVWVTQESLWLDSLSKDPNNARAHNALGNVAAGRGDLSAAEASFRRAIEIDPEYGEGHGNLGSVLAQRGDIEGAIAALKLGVTYAPKNADVHNNLANILAQRGHYAEAIVEYQLAIEQQPNFAEAYGNMGLAYAMQGQHVMAVAQLERGIDLNPRLWRLRVLLGNSLVQLGRPQDAVETYKKAVELAPGEAMAHRGLGKALAYVGDTEGALKELELSLSIDPNDASARAYYQELRGGR